MKVSMDSTKLLSDNTTSITYYNSYLIDGIVDENYKPTLYTNDKTKTISRENGNWYLDNINGYIKFKNKNGLTDDGSPIFNTYLSSSLTPYISYYKYGSTKQSFMSSNASIDGNCIISNKLYVNNDTFLNSNITIIGNTTLSNNLVVNGTSTFNSNLIVSSSNTTLGGTLNISGVSSLSNQLYVSGTSTFNSNLVVSSYNTSLLGSLNVSDVSSLSNQLYVSGTSTFNSNLVVSSYNTTLGDTLNVTGVSSLSNQLYVSGTSTFNSNLVVSSYNTSLLGTLNVSGASAFSNTTTFTSNLIVSSYNTSLLGTLNVSGASAFSNTTTFTSNLIVSSKNTSLLGTLNVTGVSALSNQLYVSSTSTFNSNLVVSSYNTSLLGTLNVTGVSALSNQLYVSSTSTFNSNLVVSSYNTSLLGTLNITGASAFSNTTTFSSNLIVSSKNTTLGGTLNVTGVSALSNQLYVSSTSTFNSNLVVSSYNTSLLGTLNVSGVSALSNQLYVSSTSTFNSNLVVSSYNTSLLGTLNVTGASAFSNTSTFTSNLIVSSKNTSLLGTLNVTGASAFSNTSTFTSNLIVKGECLFSSNIYVGTPGIDSNAILIYGGFNDTTSNFSGIMRRIYNSTEQSELAMFCYNDIESAAGPDRIRLIGANILLDTYTATTTSINDTANTSTKLIINAAGNVGIGNMTPTYKLQVEGNTYISTDCTINNNCTINNILYVYRSGTQNTPGAATVTSTGERIILYPNSGGHNSSIGHESGFMWFNVDSTVGYKFYNASSLKMILNLSGNLGIGTTNPTSKLHIVGDSYINGNSTITGNETINGILYATRVNSSTAVPGTNSVGEKLVLYSGATNLSLGIEGGFMWFNVGINDGYKFYNNSSSLRMIINSSGYVGIGTTNPTQLFYVNGTSQVNGFLFAKNISINTAGTTYSSNTSYGLVVDGAQALFNKGLTMPSGIASISETGGLVASTMSIGSGTTINKFHVVNQYCGVNPGSQDLIITHNLNVSVNSYTCYPSLCGASDIGNVTLTALVAYTTTTCTVRVNNTAGGTQAATVSLLLLVY
jgi:hypothetical protein